MRKGMHGVNRGVILCVKGCTGEKVLWRGCSEFKVVKNFSEQKGVYGGKKDCKAGVQSAKG